MIRGSHIYYYVDTGVISSIRGLQAEDEDDLNYLLSLAEEPAEGQDSMFEEGATNLNSLDYYININTGDLTIKADLGSIITQDLEEIEVNGTVTFGSIPIGTYFNLYPSEDNRIPLDLTVETTIVDTVAAITFDIQGDYECLFSFPPTYNDVKLKVKVNDKYIGAPEQTPPSV